MAASISTNKHTNKRIFYDFITLDEQTGIQVKVTEDPECIEILCLVCERPSNAKETNPINQDDEKPKPGSLPQEDATEDTRNRTAEEECPVCLELLINNEASSTVCKHVFCTNCIKTVLKIFKACPCCRHQLTLQDIHPITP